MPCQHKLTPTSSITFSSLECASISSCFTPTGNLLCSSGVILWSLSAWGHHATMYDSSLPFHSQSHCFSIFTYGSGSGSNSSS